MCTGIVIAAGETNIRFLRDFNYVAGVFEFPFNYYCEEFIRSQYFYRMLTPIISLLFRHVIENVPVKFRLQINTHLSVKLDRIKQIYSLKLLYNWKCLFSCCLFAKVKQAHKRYRKR
jgi:hypothetical protein